MRIQASKALLIVLTPFDKSLQQEAIKKLTRDVEIKIPFVVILVSGDFQLMELLLKSGMG